MSWTGRGGTSKARYQRWGFSDFISDPTSHTEKWREDLMMRVKSRVLGSGHMTSWMRRCFGIAW
jgi:hypothetical protein